MALIVIQNVFTVGGVIVASQHNSNFSIIYSDYNGNIDNTNLSASAAIADTKLAQITTVGKVSGAAVTSLSSVPSGAGALPTANGGTGQDFSASVIGSVPYVSATGVIAMLASGTSGTIFKFNGGGAAPSAVLPIAGIKDYGSSASTGTAKSLSSVYIYYGSVSVTGSSSQAITNLPFTSSSTYSVTLNYDTSTAVNENPLYVRDSGAQFTIYNNQNTRTITWQAIGT